MALEDLTGTGKYISALNPAWPVDDDWVDEGDNHIRGIKNVLKNTFPATDGAVSWSSTQARFPDGTQALPGISWIGETGSGFYRGGAGLFGASVQNVTTWSWTPTLFWVQGAGVQFRAEGASLFQGPVTVAAAGAPGGKLTVNGGFNGALANLAQAAVVVNGLAAGGSMPCLTLSTPGYVTWGIFPADSDAGLSFGTTAATGPTSQGGRSMVITGAGAVLARSFNPVTFATSDSQPIGGALDGVLKLRGVRCRNDETKRPELVVEFAGIEGVYPELVSEAEAGKAINVMGLVAPLIEAIRELEARVRVLETWRAGS